VAQEVENLANKCEALSSISSATKKKEMKEEGGGRRKREEREGKRVVAASNVVPVVCFFGCFLSSWSCSRYHVNIC
jgi:hypothetical protein